jgi:hypothetical protein
MNECGCSNWFQEYWGWIISAAITMLFFVMATKSLEPNGNKGVN